MTTLFYLCVVFSTRAKIKAEGLDNEGVARKIVSIYKKVIGK